MDVVWRSAGSIPTLKIQKKELGLNMDLSFASEGNGPQGRERKSLRASDLSGTGEEGRTLDLWIHNPAL